MVKPMGRKVTRCDDCPGCRADYCGRCVFCLDLPRFGGKGIKRQACLERRCYYILRHNLISQTAKYRKPCGHCDFCLTGDEDCGLCLPCMDKSRFNSQYMQGAMCFRKKCEKPVWVTRPKINYDDDEDSTEDLELSNFVQKSTGFTKRKLKDGDYTKEEADSMSVQESIDSVINQQNQSKKATKKRKLNFADDWDNDLEKTHQTKLKLSKSKLSIKKINKQFKYHEQFLKSSRLKSLNKKNKKKYRLPKISGQTKKPNANGHVESIVEQRSDHRKKIIDFDHFNRFNPCQKPKIDEQLFFRTLHTPKNNLERAFLKVIEIGQNIKNTGLADSSHLNVPEPEEIIEKVLQKYTQNSKVAKTETLQLYQSLPCADFVQGYFAGEDNKMVLNLANQNCENIINSLSVEPVRIVDNTSECKHDANTTVNNNLSDTILLGYIVSLDKDQLKSHLTGSNLLQQTFANFGNHSQPTNVSQSAAMLNNNENSQLQLKLMQMHQQHHNYAAPRI